MLSFFGWVAFNHDTTAGSILKSFKILASGLIARTNRIVLLGIDELNYFQLRRAAGTTFCAATEIRSGFFE